MQPEFISTSEVCRKMTDKFGRRCDRSLLWLLREEHGDKIGEIRTYGNALCWPQSAVDAIEGLLRDRWAPKEKVSQ